MNTLPTRQFVPYVQVPTGFEAVYAGENSATPIAPEGWPVSRFTDPQGRVILQWSTWTWQSDPAKWDREIQRINTMQQALCPLDDATRQVRAHLGSLVLCEPGIPATIDDLLASIGRGGFLEPPFNAGCWPNPLGWECRGTQAGQAGVLTVIEQVLHGYLDGKTTADLAAAYPDAAGFIRRAFTWLPPLDRFTPVQRLLLERMLLPFDFFTWRDRNDAVLVKDYYGENGRGAALDRQIAELASLPRIYPNYSSEYHTTLLTISDLAQQVLYRICGELAHGLHTLSDCHHSSMRWVEQWVHDLATLQVGIPERTAGTERTRLAQLLFGYTLGLDRWLAGQSLEFLLLDLAYVDLGFDPKNELLRVYAYLGPERTPVKRWLAACLWKNLSGGGSPRRLENPQAPALQEKLNQRAMDLGFSPPSWLNE